MAVSLCTVSGTVYDADGTKLNGVAVQFYGHAPQGVGVDLVAATKVEVTTGDGAWADGYFEVTLIQGSEVRVRSNVLKIDDVVITIPATASANFSTLLEAAL